MTHEATAVNNTPMDEGGNCATATDTPPPIWYHAHELVLMRDIILITPLFHIFFGMSDPAGRPFAWLR